MPKLEPKNRFENQVKNLKVALPEGVIEQSTQKKAEFEGIARKLSSKKELAKNVWYKKGSRGGENTDTFNAKRKSLIEEMNQKIIDFTSFIVEYTGTSNFDEISKIANALIKTLKSTYSMFDKDIKKMCENSEKTLKDIVDIGKQSEGGYAVECKLKLRNLAEEYNVPYEEWRKLKHEMKETQLQGEGKKRQNINLYDEKVQRKLNAVNKLTKEFTLNSDILNSECEKFRREVDIDKNVNKKYPKDIKKINSELTGLSEKIEEFIKNFGDDFKGDKYILKYNYNFDSESIPYEDTMMAIDNKFVIVMKKVNEAIKAFEIAGQKEGFYQNSIDQASDAIKKDLLTIAEIKKLKSNFKQFTNKGVAKSQSVWAGNAVRTGMTEDTNTFLARSRKIFAKFAEYEKNLKENLEEIFVLYKSTEKTLKNYKYLKTWGAKFASIGKGFMAALGGIGSILTSPAFLNVLKATAVL